MAAGAAGRPDPMTGAATTFYGLLLLWVGAVSLGALVLLRDRWRAGAGQGGVAALPAGWRKAIEAVCLFAGSLGMIAGLGILALGVLR
jgi:hypothetical protein